MGGQVLFGTDVGYMTDHDPMLEYELMAKAGMTPMQILASLTTSPAARWQEQHRRGRLAAGMDADLVVLDADPADSPRHFAKVRCAIRGGQVIYARR
jgi:imidazolonepropionase-like amidohydrolase